jgi:hypothetical protein
VWEGRDMQVDKEGEAVGVGVGVAVGGGGGDRVRADVCARLQGQHRAAAGHGGTHAWSSDPGTSLNSDSGARHSKLCTHTHTANTGQPDTPGLLLPEGHAPDAAQRRPCPQPPH